MKKGEAIYIQPDARGRILLPKKLRDCPLVQLSGLSNGYLLTPMEVRPSSQLLKSELPTTWLNPQVEIFMSSELIPKLNSYFEKQRPSFVMAMFLFGSRVEGTAHTNSDFDLGVLCSPYPSLFKRSEVTDRLNEFLSTEFKTLEGHSVGGELSVVFLPSEVSGETVSPIHYSIFENHRLIASVKNVWDDYLKTIRIQMKKQKVKKLRSGKQTVWQWNNKS